MRVALRVIALIIGALGFVDGVIANVIVAAYRDVAHLIGVDVAQSHGIIGFIICVVGLVGAILVLRLPIVGAILLLIATFGFVVVHWWCQLASPQFAVAAMLAILDRVEAPRPRLGRPGRRSHVAPRVVSRPLPQASPQQARPPAHRAQWECSGWHGPVP